MRHVSCISVLIELRHIVSDSADEIIFPFLTLRDLESHMKIAVSDATVLLIILHLATMQTTEPPKHT
jgi:hypothetical protein